MTQPTTVATTYTHNVALCRKRCQDEYTKCLSDCPGHKLWPYMTYKLTNCDEECSDVNYHCLYYACLYPEER